MKVLLISHACRSRSAGQKKAQLLAEKLGVELQLIVPHSWNDSWNDRGAWKVPEAPANPAYTYTPMKVCWPWLGPAQSYLHWYPKLRTILKEFQPDVIDLWEEPWGLVSGHTCWLRDRIVPHAKLICETEQNIFKTLPLPFQSIRKYVLSRADLMVGRSAEAVEVLRRNGYEGAVAVVPNAVDAEVFRLMDRVECRKKLGVNGFVVGFVGRLVEAKGLSDLLQAISLCPTEVNLVIVGKGDFESEIVRMIKSLNLSGRVRIIPAVPSRELPAIFNAMDVLAVPSRTTPRWKEQFGRVIIEAQACGIPVVGSDSGAIPQVIGKGGLVVSEQNPKALANAFLKLFSNSALCHELGTVGLETVSAQFTWMAVAQQMYGLYQRALGINSHTKEEPSIRLNRFAPAEGT